MAAKPLALGLGSFCNDASDPESDQEIIAAQSHHPARISESTGVPAVGTVGVCVGKEKLTWSFSAFTVLVYCGITNLCAIRMKPGERLYSIWPAHLGLAGALP